MPKDKKRPGFLFELKAEKDRTRDELKTLAQNALRQIADNKYDTEMLAHGVSTIVKYGVAFSGKNVEIAIE